MELWRLLHLDPESEAGLGGEPRGDENTDFQTPEEQRPEFSGGTEPASEIAPPADPNQRVSHSPATESEWTSIRDAARQAGFDFGHGVEDDSAALKLLLQRAQSSRQQNMYEQLGRQLAPRAEELQRFLGGPQAAPATPERKPWEAPEFDRRWASLVERDPNTGLFFAKQGTPPEIARKVNEYVEWKDKFDANPAAVLNEMVQAQAQEVARQTFASQFAEQQRNYEIQRIVGENRNWMYQQDANGQVARDFDGQPVMTPHGSRYVYHVQNLVRAGVSDPSTQDRIAKDLVRGEWTTQWYQNQSAQQANADTKQRATSMGQPTNPAQTRPPSTRHARNTPEPTTTGLSLQEALMRALKEENVTDDDIHRSVNIGE